MNSSYSFCVLGSVCSDIVINIPVLPAAGRVIEGTLKTKGFGGKGSNPAVLVGRMNESVCYLGQVGKDFTGEDVLTYMSKNNVNVENVRRIDHATAQAFVFLQERGENTIIANPGANIIYKSLDIIPESYKKAIENSQILLLSRSVPNQLNVLCAKYAQEKNLLVALDYGYRDDPFSEELLKAVDFVNPNEVELLKLLDDAKLKANNTEEFRSVLLKKFPNLRILLKLGSQGSQIITNEIDIKIPTVNKIKPEINDNYKIVDTTGAGDCFIASFFVKYKELFFVNGRKPNLEEERRSPEKFRQCLIFASSCSFLCITKVGSMNSMPFKKEIDSFLSLYFPEEF